MNKMNKYYKNMILCSELDYHCLLCEESFEDIKEVEKHIRWETHRQNLKNPMCVRKYKEIMYKIRDLYYCEVCNSVVKAVKEHTKPDNREHKNLTNSRLSLAKRDSSGLIKFAKLTVNRLQWHGIINDKCSLCDTVIKDANDHINSTKHMVNIIQSEVIESQENYYRQMDKNIYCFNCANNINEDTMSKHTCKTDKGKKGLNKSYLKVENCKSPIKEYPISTEKHAGHLKDTTHYLDLKDHGKLRSELATYGKENFIKLNEGGSNGYCSLCNINISAHMNVAKEHVNGRLHKGYLELKGLIARKKHSSPGYKVQSLQNLLKHIFHVPAVNVYCINFAMTINIMSFMYITVVENKKQVERKCFCCDMVFNYEEVNAHCKTKKHMNASLASDLLVMDNEFIRIIRPGLFHCGFCNKVFPFWETMNKHLDSWEHKYAQKSSLLACTDALAWYAEHEKSGAVNIADKLSRHLINMTI